MCNKNMSDKEAVIIGAGWSGLACAVTLAHHGYKVYLLESARQVGGRARKVNFKRFLANQTIDNGQHIMLGAYHATISLLKLIGIKENDFLERHQLELNMYSPEYSMIKLKAPATCPIEFTDCISNYERNKILCALQNYKNGLKP